MKTLFIIGGIVLIITIFLSIRKIIRRSRTFIYSVLDISPMRISPVLEPRKINLFKESLYVRRSLDFVKIASSSLRDPRLVLFETYSPNEPDASKKLIVVERLRPSVRYSVDAGFRFVYVKNGAYYLAKSAEHFIIEPYSSERYRFITSEGDTIGLSRERIIGGVQEVYGDYRIQKTNTN